MRHLGKARFLLSMPLRSERDRALSRTDGKEANVAERTLILKLVGGQWSACYSDRPEEKAYGLSIDTALERLKQRRRPLADGATMTFGEQNAGDAESA